MKKILIDLERLKYPNTGIATIFENLAKGLNKKSLNFSIYFFGPKSNLLKFISKSQIISHSPVYKFFDLSSHKYDLIHVSHQLSSYFQKDYKQTIKIVTLHDLNFLKENLPQKKIIENIKKVNNNLKYADYIVCISNYVKQDFLENKHLFDLKKLKDIFVIHNGIQIPKDKDYDLGQYNFLKQKKYILNIGVLFPKKNQMVLLDLINRIEEDLVLVVSGQKQDYFEKIMLKIKELNIENKVYILRHVSLEEKFALIQNCHAMIHPSIAEGFGVPPVEAMMFGKPIFLSNKTSLPEIGGKYAYYFDNFNINEMIDIYHQGMKMYNENAVLNAKNIKNWSLNFSLQKMTEKYTALYNQLLK